MSVKYIIDKCPHCGSTKGMYSKYSLYGLRRYYYFDGLYEDNMDNVSQRGGNKLYCQNCDKFVCKYEDLVN